MSAEWPLYQSHKKVRALEIDHVTEGGPKGRIVFFTGGGTNFPPLLMPAEAFARYTPVKGDFLVEYEDGYRSFSPAKAFAEGYSRVDA